MLAEAVAPTLDRGSCPHMAVLLKSEDELPRVLASFYALGARRNGWLVHRSVQGEGQSDRAALEAAGLDVGALERERRTAIVEFDPAEPREESTAPWERGLDDALARGLSGLWYSRFAVGPDEAAYGLVLEFERAWEACFHGRPVVTLCPYVVGELGAGATLDRFDALAEIHDAMLMPAGNGFRLVET